LSLPSVNAWDSAAGSAQGAYHDTVSLRGRRDTARPWCLVAIPAYVLNGRLIVTGNPTPDALARVLSLAGTSDSAIVQEET
jgi:hypothetical protein